MNARIGWRAKQLCASPSFYGRTAGRKTATADAAPNFLAGCSVARSAILNLKASRA
jgi:hypothetical protein